MKKGLLLLLIPFIASCSDSGLYIRKINNPYLNETSSLFDSVPATYDVSKLKSSSEYIDSLLESPSYRERDFYNNMGLFLSELTNLMPCLYKARAIYYGDRNSTTQENWMTIYNDYLTYFTWYGNSLPKIKNSQYKRVMFGNMSDQEIDEVIERYYTPPEASEIEYQMTEIENDMNTLYGNKSQYTNDEFSIETLKLYKEYVPLANSLASLYGYDSYQKYAYEKTYNRKYSISDMETLGTNLKTLITPLLNEIEVENTLNASEQQTYNIINYACFMYNGSETPTILANFANKMGNEYYSNYKHLLTSGAYYFSSSSNCAGTAFTSQFYNDEPMVFFGKNYQSVSTFTHEFGHYLNYRIGEFDNSYDILETHSQTSTKLYNAYLKNYLTDHQISNQKAYKYYLDLSLYEDLMYLLLEESSVEMEAYVFANYQLDVNDLYTNIKTKLNSYPTNMNKMYWAYTSINSAFYYPSYVTSGVTSLLKYFDAMKDFDLASENYISLVKDKNTNDEIDIWCENNFKSPFTYSNIEQLANFSREYFE